MDETKGFQQHFCSVLAFNCFTSRR